MSAKPRITIGLPKINKKKRKERDNKNSKQIWLIRDEDDDGDYTWSCRIGK